MRNIKLAGKISLGFGLLIVIALALGGVAVFDMHRVGSDAARLAKEFVPEVALANDMERSAQQAMFEMRAFGLTGDEAYYKQSQDNLAELKKHLESALDHANKYPALAHLKDNAVNASSKVAEYDKLVQETVNSEKAQQENRALMDKASAAFQKATSGYQESQTTQLKKEIDFGNESGMIAQRLEKTLQMDGIIELGNAVQVANYRGQAMRQFRLVQEAMKNFALMEKKFTALTNITFDKDELQRIDDVKAAAAGYQKAMTDLLATWQATDELAKKRMAVANQVVAAARSTAKAALEHTVNVSGVSVTNLSDASLVLIIGLAAALLLGIALAIFITLSITRPINRVISGLSEGAAQVASAAGQVNNASQQLASGAAEQAAALEQTSSSLEEMASMTKTNADNASQANHLAGEANQVVETTSQAMGELTKSMAEISQASEDTGRIIRTIDEIAFQTNLLALNAAVEAARAGEAGAGFAVVAEEVRNLAMRAAEAAKNTAGLIEGTLGKVKEGSAIVARADQAFTGVATISAKVSGLVGEIAAASAEQAKGIEQVNKAANEVDKVTQQNAANAGESAAAAEELTSQAETMTGYVAELAGLVGSGRSGRSWTSAERRGEPGRPPAKPAALPAPAPKPGHQGPNPQRSARAAKPEDVIPLDDDFKDF